MQALVDTERRSHNLLRRLICCHHREDDREQRHPLAEPLPPPRFHRISPLFSSATGTLTRRIRCPVESKARPPRMGRYNPPERGGINEVFLGETRVRILALQRLNERTS